jgi:hypothetical protein
MMKTGPQHLRLFLAGALGLTLTLVVVVLPLAAARGLFGGNSRLVPAPQSSLVTLDSTYVGKANLKWAAAGLYSDTLHPPTGTLPELGSIDLGFLLHCDHNNLNGYVDLSTTLVFTREHIVTTTQAVTTPLAVGPAVFGTCNGANVRFESERFEWVTSAGQEVERQFRLIGVARSTGVISGEYRETLWGYGYQPYTIVGNFNLALVSGNGVALTPRVYLPLLRR